MAERFVGEVCEITSLVRTEMVGRSWRDEAACPRFESLRLVRLSHHDFEGRVGTGELVVLASLAEEVLAIFERIFAAGFPIASMKRIDAYGASDEASMAANNSSAFNFRRVQGTSVLSHHALGVAIDLNPVQNPWVRGDRVDPPSARAYLDRSDVRPGMIVRPGPVLAAFEAHGWDWGGDWQDVLDFHHFSKLPR